MPVTREIGTAGAANALIGGVPINYYYDFASKGRGEVLRLFFEDAGIAFTDVRFSFDEVNGKSLDERAEINPVGSVPYLTLNGTLLTQSYAILRSFARRLSAYDGVTDEEKYLADIFCDLALDWRTLFVTSAFVNSVKGLNANEDSAPFANHKAFNLPKYIKGVEGHLASNPLSASGPYTLGATITYADFVLYQIYHDEREIGGIDLTDAPHLKALVQAMEARPNIKAYMASDRYYN